MSPLLAFTDKFITYINFFKQRKPPPTHSSSPPPTVITYLVRRVTHMPVSSDILLALSEYEP